MQQRRVEILPSFTAALRELAPDIQRRTEDVVVHFVERTAENALRPELKNGFDGVWTFRITNRYRAFYLKDRDPEGAIFRLFHVGHHDDYRVIKNRIPRMQVTVTMNKRK